MVGEITFSKPAGWRGYSNGTWYPAMRGTLELPDKLLHVHEPLDGRWDEEIQKVLRERLAKAAAPAA